ncbi:MAG: hypothetical protein WBC83_02505 [Minisyncoccia bacterium]
MPDEITSNPEPANTPIPQAPETPISTPPEAVIVPAPEEAPTEPVPTLEPIPDERTAQMGGNEPFAPAPTETQTTPTPPEVAPIETTQPTPTEPVIEVIPVAHVEISSPTPTPAPAQVSEPTPAQVIATVVTPVVVPVIAQTFGKSIRELFTKAQLAIQNRKRKKIDRVMDLFAKRTSITNNEVEKLLHISDATATRYLSALEKEGKIKQSGKTGKGVSYSKI